MAFYGNQFPREFPPQTQDQQPGQQYVMNPRPIITNPDYKPSNKLKGKVALVTGGDSGIGEAVCYSFALEGASVAFTYVKGREDKDASNTLQMLKQAKAADAKDPISIPTDVGYEENCKAVVDEVVKNFGRVDILVNNAAIQYEENSVEDISAEQLERVFRTNIFSHFYMIKHALKHMSGGSSIINTASVNAYKGHRTLLDYTATKGAIVAFTRALALQLVSKGIRVNGVAPGPVWTPLIPATMTAEENSRQGSEFLKPGDPYVDLGVRNVSTMPPPKKLVQSASNGMLPPSPRNMPPPPPKFPSPPVLPSQNADDKNSIAKKPTAEPVPDTLMKLAEYGEEDDDAEVAGNESPKFSGSGLPTAKPFWAL